MENNTKNLEKNLICSYYTGAVERSKVWVLVSALRGTEHVCFDRTLDVQNSIFEFFVPSATEHIFLEVMDYFKKEGVLLTLEKKENRLLHDAF